MLPAALGWGRMARMHPRLTAPHRTAPYRAAPRLTAPLRALVRRGYIRALLLLYFEYNSTTNCSWAAIGMFGRVGRSSIRPLNDSLSTAIHESGAPRDA